MLNSGILQPANLIALPTDSNLSRYGSGHTYHSCATPYGWTLLVLFSAVQLVCCGSPSVCRVLLVALIPHLMLCTLELCAVLNPACAFSYNSISSLFLLFSPVAHPTYYHLCWFVINFMVHHLFVVFPVQLCPCAAVCCVFGKIFLGYVIHHIVKAASHAVPVTTTLLPREPSCFFSALLLGFGLLYVLQGASRAFCSSPHVS